MPFCITLRSARTAAPANNTNALQAAGDAAHDDGRLQPALGVRSKLLFDREGGLFKIQLSRGRQAQRGGLAEQSSFTGDAQPVLPLETM